MASFVVFNAKSASQKNAALVTAADGPAALTAAAALGVDVRLAEATQVQAGDLSTSDVAFYGNAISNAAPWPTQDRGA